MPVKIGRRKKTQAWGDIPFELSLAEVMKDLVEPQPRFGGHSGGVRTRSEVRGQRP